jgi:hypothetical protein
MSTGTKSLKQFIQEQKRELIKARKNEDCDKDSINAFDMLDI